jgi:SAM-dependent methyltransferase
VNQHVATPSFEAYGGTAPENYERYFVPAIGLPLALDLVEFAELRRGERVLDLACGTGVVARLAADRIGPTGQVTGLDANAGMLAVARSVASAARIEWREGPAEDTGLADDAYDAALCQLGLQFFTDRAAALGELKRVVAPGGRVVANVPGPMPPVFQILQRGIRDHISLDVAKFISAVFALDDAGELEELFAASGLGDVSVRRHPRVLRLPAPEEFLWQYVWSTPLAEPIGALDDADREGLRDDVVAGWEPLTEDGALILELDVLAVTAENR